MQNEILNLNVSYQAILPELVVSLAGILVLLYGVFYKPAKWELAFLNITGFIAAGVAAVGLWQADPYAAYSGMIVVDRMRVAFIFIFIVVGILTSIASLSFIEDEHLASEEYFSLIMFASVGMMLMASAADLVMIFLGLEITSISTYVLSGYRRSDLRSNESALKYFILGSFSTAFLLYGMSLIYGATGSSNLELIRSAIKAGTNLASQKPIITELLFMGVAMMLIGFAFKIAAVPFHVWTPDVYEGAPTPVTAFMAAGPKAAAFAAFLRVFLFTFNENYSADLYAVWSSMLQVLAILTMIVGNVVALTQTNIKRMLAYSSIAHAGYVLIGFLSDDWTAVAFYLLSYSIMNIGAFTVISVLAGKGDERTELDDYAGLGFKSLGLCICLLVFMLSLAGVPLTGGFIGKFLIFKSAWEHGYHTLVIVAVLNSAASVYYYLRPMVVLFFKESNANSPALLTPRSISLALFLAIVGILYLGIMPGRLLDLMEVAKQSLAMAQ